jgi:ribonuclease T2
MEQSMRIVAAGLGGAALLVIMMAPRSAHADVAMSGTFTATQTCPAYQSFRKATDPGDVKIEQSKTYAR